MSPTTAPAWRRQSLLHAFLVSVTCVVVGLSALVAAPVATAAPAASGPVVGSTATPSGRGYWQFSADGGVYPFGDAVSYGSQAGKAINAPVVGMTATPTGRGYWLVAADGGVFSFGDAGFFGSQGGKALNEPVVGMSATPTGRGYWLVAADGGIFTFGDAGFYGSQGGKALNRPVVGMASTPSGRGYWMVASDGGIFTFGDAGFYGSQGGKALNQPVVGMAATPTGRGYWLVAADGGIFTFGDAGFSGSAGGTRLNQPVVGMTRTPGGRGYWLVAADGGVFTYGDAPYLGGASWMPPAPTPSRYRAILPAGTAKSSLDAKHHDYPALDIAVASGTPYFAVTSGRVRYTTDAACGTGLMLIGDDGVTYTYCHGSARSVTHGAWVNAGTQLGTTGNTGRSSGPHLHFQVRVSSLRCPQAMVSALAAGKLPPAPADLPTAGCYT